MRLAAQAKMGYYPAAPEAIEQLTKHLYCRAPNPEKKYDTINILDPCAGEGRAIQQLATALGVSENNVYSVELDAGRSAAIKALMPTSHHIGPATFLHFGVQITGFSFSLAYVNPPFDSELGGGRREEQAFTEEATRKLAVKGILVLVCPIGALCGNRSFVEFIDSHFEEVAVYKFPDDHRPYNEIVVIGRKRPTAIPGDKLYEVGKLHAMQMQWRGYITCDSLPTLGDVQPENWSNGRPSYGREKEVRTWEIPHSWRPNVFKKTMFTEEELAAVVSNSPLGRLLDEVIVPPPAAPPLPLDKGHLGLILASGMLDGPVDGPHGVHVVRGSSHKVEYHNKEQSSSEMNPETGAVTTKDVFSERPITVIRVVEQSGVIYTHSNAPEEKKEDEGSDYNGDCGFNPNASAHATMRTREGFYGEEG